MSEQERTTRAACDRYAPTLAMLDEPGLDADERRAALAHLAGCARCQADQRAYARMDADLRRAYGPAVAAPQSTAALLAAIGATGEAPIHATIHSEVDLGDIANTGRTSRMRDPDRHDDTSAPTRRVAPSSTLDARLGWQRWTVGFGAVAVTLVVIVIAATLFSMRARLSPTPATGAAATQTAQAQSHLNAAHGVVVAISMDSPTDGWAISQHSASSLPPTPSGGNTPSGVDFYHYNGSAWVLTQSFPQFQPRDGLLPGVYLKMFSPTDGWAYGWNYMISGQLLHYDGVAWRPMSISLPGGVQVSYMQTLDMISPTDGWAAAFVKGGAAGAGAVGILRYDGQQWTLDTTNFALPSGVDASQLTITSFTETPGGDVWATAAAPSGTGGIAIVFHRVNGVWTVANTPHSANTATTITPMDIYMSSPTSGWIAAEAYQNTTTSEGTGTTVHPLLLRYDGASWTPVTVPLATATNDAPLLQIAAMGPDDIWVSGRASSATVTSSGLQISSLLLRYDGQTWSQVTPSVSIKGGNAASITNIALAPDGSLWAVGSLTALSGAQGGAAPLFLRYHNGAWSVTPATSDK